MNNDKKETSQGLQDQRVLSFRAPKIVQRQIADLVMAWGENTTHVIHRALAMAHEREFGRKKKVAL